jgi:hypothetical protein
MGEVPSENRDERRFERDETSLGSVPPQSTKLLWKLDYCTQCAADNIHEGPPFSNAIVGGLGIAAKVWVNGKEYEDRKTVLELLSA